MANVGQCWPDLPAGARTKTHCLLALPPPLSCPRVVSPPLFLRRSALGIARHGHRTAWHGPAIVAIVTVVVLFRAKGGDRPWVRAGGGRRPVRDRGGGKDPFQARSQGASIPINSTMTVTMTISINMTRFIARTQLRSRCVQLA